MEGMPQKDAARWVRIGVLAALSLALGYLETFVPIPIPGVKLGLANIAVLLCFMRLDAGAALFVTLLKVLAQGLLFGSPLTFAYSLAGSAAAFLVMALAVRIPGMHPVMVSVLGAVAHTAGQMAVAAVLLGTRFVWLAAPVLAVAAVATGILCGVLAQRLDRMLSERAESGRAPDASIPVIEIRELPEVSEHPVGALLAAFAVFTVLAIVFDDILVLALLFGIADIACILAHVEPAALMRGLRAFLVLLVVSAVAHLVAYPLDEALAAIARMGLRLASIMGMSLALMAFLGKDDLLAFTVRTARRLERRGVSVQGPLLALNVCLQTVPVLAAGAESGTKGFSVQALSNAIAEAYGRADALAASISREAGEERP